MNDPNPPERGERLVKWSLAPWERPAVMGDLQEEFRDLAATAGEPAARKWYWRQAITSMWPNARRRLQGDDGRYALWSQGMQGFACGCIWMAGNWAFGRPLDAFVGTGWMIFGAITIAESLFRKRVRASAVQIKVGSMLTLVAIAGTLLAAKARPLMAQQFLWASLVPVVMIRLWPWWPADPPPTAYLVGRRADPDQDPGALLTIAVPNAPLGMSGLVLLHAPAGATVETAPRPIRRSEPTLDRAFTPADAVRVCAVVNLAGPSAQATLDVVDATGRVAQTVETTVGASSLEQVVKHWDDIADEDPAEHFGQVDVTLPLANLAPGPYRLRVTASDGGHKSQQEESIVVRAAAPSPIG